MSKSRLESKLSQASRRYFGFAPIMKWKAISKHILRPGKRESE
jgi:hypothetical protein